MKRKTLFIMLMASLVLCLAGFAGCSNNDVTRSNNDFTRSNNDVALNKVTIEYIDADGSLLNSYVINEGELHPSFDLPADTAKWNYTEWTKDEQTDKVQYIAQRNPNRTYFIGNVFQIIGKDFMGEPILSGTGFVIDKSGLFITNNHVMEDAYEVSAYFEIKNQLEGETYTVLPVEIGYYNDSDKDMFIGKITDYSSIDSYYKPIEFDTEHIIGGTTYSVGYPNSVPNMEINKGSSFEDAQFLSDKVTGNISYILSDSYTAHGSSGGILVDTNLDVIGITTCGWTDADDEFICGGSINAFNVVPKINTAKSSKAQYITNIYHSTELVNMKIFRGLSNLTDARLDEENGETVCICTGTVEGVDSSNEPYSFTTKTSMTTDFYIVHEEKLHWGTGVERVLRFYGNYDDEIGLESLHFSFKYTWADGTYYTLDSDNVNYSKTTSLTLINYTLRQYDYTVSDENITYAKEIFNFFYDSFMYLLASMWINADNHQTILVGITANYSPFAYYDDGKLVGFEIELMNAICSEIGYDVEYVVVPVDEIFSQLEDESVSCSIAALTKTPARDEDYTPSDVYYIKDELSYVIYSTYGNENLTEKINNALTKLRNNGTLSNLASKYEL